LQDFGRDLQRQQMPLPDAELLRKCIRRILAQLPVSDVKLLNRAQNMSFVRGELILFLQKRLRCSVNAAELLGFRVGLKAKAPVACAVFHPVSSSPVEL